MSYMRGDTMILRVAGRIPKDEASGETMESRIWGVEVHCGLVNGFFYFYTDQMVMGREGAITRLP